MNIFEKIKQFFSKNKIKQLPEATRNNIKTEQSNAFLESLEVNDDPFSKLLSNENMERINIEEELKPLFEETILKIKNYFVKNDLMYVKNYDEFFENYLLDGNLEIKMVAENELPNRAAGIYIKKENQILMLRKNQHDLCHEFIHFLVMADSNKLNWSPSQINFINEGYTELLAAEIYGIYPQAYLEEVDMVKFLNLFSETKDSSKKSFLKDEFSFGDEYMWLSINNYSKYYINNGDKNSYRQIQRSIINNLIDIDNIKSVENYIQVIDQLKKRPSFDKEYMKEYFNNLNKKFLENMQLPLDKRNVSLLNQYCDASYKAEAFGDRKVFEFNFDDINGAFDINGNVYGDIPDDGATCQRTKYIELRHNKEKKNYSLENFEGINWVEQYNKAKQSLYTFLNYKEKDGTIR